MENNVTDTGNGSSSFSLNLTDLKKIGKGAVIAILGAVLAYIVSNGLPNNLDWRSWMAFLGAVSSVAVNTAWKFVVDNSKKT